MGNKIYSFEDLNVWQEGMALVRHVYRISQNMPREELYGLVSQIRRCAVSIPSNIAEGNQRESTKDYLRYLAIAMGSLGELRTQLLIAQDLAYVDSLSPELLDSMDKTGRMIRNLQKSLRAKIPPESRVPKSEPLEEAY